MFLPFQKLAIWCHHPISMLPRWLSSKEPAFQCRRCRNSEFNPWVGKIPWRGKWQPTLVSLPGKSHGQRSLSILSYLYCWLHGYLFVKTSGEGNGTPLQYSCLENLMDGGAWWAAVHGVAKSQTWLSNFTFTFMHWRGRWQPTPVFLPGESQGWGSLLGCCLWGRTESDTTEVT